MIKRHHGGEIYDKEIELDFSVNVNPYGLPEGVKDCIRNGLDGLEQYPDMECRRLKQKIAEQERYFTGTEVKTDQILCGNGASELISAVTHVLKPKKALIAAPAFLGYEKALEQEQTEILYDIAEEAAGFHTTDTLLKKMEQENAALLFLANPSNPAGTKIDGKLLEQILEAADQKAVTVMIDECFLPFSADFGERTCAGKINRFPGLIVLRAFTKLYAMPGIRLGYLYCGDQKLLQKLTDFLPEWNVSGLAQKAGIAAAADYCYVKKSGLWINHEREWLKEQLRMMGFKVVDGTADFLLFQGPEGLYERLLKKKILIRDCSDYVGIPAGKYYRIAVRKHAENLRLLQELETESRR